MKQKLKRFIDSLFIKRLLDVFVSLIVLIPVMLIGVVVSVVIFATMGRPIFFRQQRPGRYGKIFNLLKFRTMLIKYDAEQFLLPDWERLHPVGSFIRRFSLDEIPQLFNVLIGDMSLIGPRPLLVSYLNRYTTEHSHRHDVRPGITGWAQVHGRQELLFSQRLDFDVWYVRNRSLALDLKILFLTGIQVIKRSGVRPGQDVRDVDDVGLNE